MGEPKFTKGPWKALTTGNAYNSETIVTFKDAADGWICTVYDDCDDCALPDDANAHLIAAAPDLYEALEQCQRALSDLTTKTQSDVSNVHMYAQIREAELAARATLKRARGEA